MKKIILTVLILLTILIASCNDTVEQESKVPIEIIESTSITLPITPYVEGVRYYCDSVREWEQYLKGNYNIEIDMIAIEIYDISNGIHNVRSELKDIWPGLVLLKTADFVAQSFKIEKYVSEGQILSLNEFLKDSKIWNTLPDEVTNAFKDTEGNIWAIPFDDELYVKGRIIRNDWLKELNLKAPDTLDDLYEVMQRMTYDDPDGNKKNDTYGDFLVFNQYTVFPSQFYDIFEANGVYLTYENSSGRRYSLISGIGNRLIPIGVNPESGKLENSVESPDLKETFDYIKLLTDSNLYEFADRSKMVQLRINDYVPEEIYGCRLDFIKQYQCDQEKYSYALALTGSKDIYTSSVLSGGSNVYVLSSNANVEEAKEYIPKLIDTFYGTKDGYVFGRYGITGEDYKYSYTNGKVVQNRVGEETDTDMQLVGNLSWYEEVVNKQVNDDKYLSRTEIFNDERVFLLSPLTTSMIKYAGDVLDTEIPSINTILGSKFCFSFSSFVLGEISSEDLVAEWKKICKLHKIDEKIAEENKLWFGQ